MVAGAVGLAFGLPATRFAGPYLALATFAIPLSFIGLLKRFPHFTGGNVGKNLPQLHSELGVHTNPSVWFYIVCWIVALVMLAARVPDRPRALRPLAARGPRQRDRLDGERRLDRRASRPPRSGSRRSSAASPAALFAIGITYVNPDTFPIDLSILLLVGVVVGGAGSLGGMVFGALFVEFIRISWGPALLAEVSRVHPHQHARAGSPLRRSTASCCCSCLYVAPAGAAGVCVGGCMRRSAGRTKRERFSFASSGPV